MLQFILPALIGTVVDKVVDRLVEHPTVAIERIDAPVVKPVIKEVVREEIKPVIEHLTNNEPWYQSRVTLGSLASIISGALGLFGYMVGVEDVTQLLVIIMPILGGLFALWGRYIAKKPLGA